MVSELPRTVALVTEGRTDQFVLAAILSELAHARGLDLTIRPIQPKYDAIQDSWSQGGWGHVYAWCRDIVATYGSLEQYLDLMGIDLLLLQLDADVAYMSYSDYASIGETDSRTHPLPIATPCPHPPCAIPCHAVKAIPIILKSWLDTSHLPANVILCIPSKSMDAWIVGSMPMADFGKHQHDHGLLEALEHLECLRNPEICFSYTSKLGKSLRSYRNYEPTFRANLSRLAKRCVMAATFMHDLTSALDRLG